MANQGISFLYNFQIGNRNVDTPDIDIIDHSPTAEGDFAPENIWTDSVRHTWRTADSTTPQFIVIKAQEKSKIDTFAILGHNFTEDAIVIIEGAGDDNFVGATTRVTTIANPDNIVLTDGFFEECLYYKITVIDPTNGCGFLEFGRVVGGQAIIMENDEDITDTYTVNYKDNSETLETLGFFTESNENITSRDLTCSFSKLYTVEGKDGNYINLRKMFKVVKKTKPFLTILDRKNPSKLSMWGQLKSIPNDSFTVNDFVSMSLGVREVF